MPGVFEVTGAIKFYPGQGRMASGFIVRKKNQLNVENVTGNQYILIINNVIDDIDQGEKNNVNQITTDLLKNINSATWNATMKMINDKKSVPNAFTDKFFFVGNVGKNKDDTKNNAKKVLICLTNGIDAYRRLKYDNYVGFNDITSRYKGTQSYISGDVEQDKHDLLNITNNVFNAVYTRNDIAKTIDDLKSIYANTVAFLNDTGSEDPEPSAPAAASHAPQTAGGIETIGIRYPLSRILGLAK